ncbi:MAG: hypothetical protein K2G49_03130 [Muribaculum sp.]|nr:hypothetical protein [Muribaculum sp.]
MLHRVAVGRLEGRPQHMHRGHGGRNAGELPLAPTLPVWVSVDNLL